MAKDLKEWWENESLINKLFVKPALDLATLPGDVYAGEVPLYGEEGRTSPELIERAANAAGTIPLAGLGAGARPAANTLFSGAFPEQAVVDPLEAEMQKMLADLQDPNFSFGKEVPDLPEPDLAQVPFYTGDAPTDQLISEAGQLGWKEDYLTNLTKMEDFEPKDLYWYLDPQNLNNFSVAANAKDFIKPDYFTESLKPKSLDTTKYPWLAKPQTPEPDWEAKTYQTPPGSFEGMPVMPGTSAWEYLTKFLYQERIPAQEQIIKMLDLNAPREDRVAENLKLLESLPSDWREKVIDPPEIAHAIDMSQKGWKETVPSKFQGGEAERAGAEAMGFDPDKMYYKGTRYPEFAFLDPRLKPRNQALFFSDDPMIGDAYGRYLYPVHLKMKNPLVEDFLGEDIDSRGWLDDLVEKAISGGHDSAIIKNVADVGGVQNQYMIFKPNQARSTYAKFDPAREEENNLLASQVGGVSPFSWLIPEDEKRKPLGQYRF